MTKVLAAIEACTADTRPIVSRQTSQSRVICMPCSTVAPLGEVKCTTVPSSWNRLTSSIPGMVFTPSRFSVLCNLLSSVEVVLWTAFFFLPPRPQLVLPLAEMDLQSLSLPAPLQVRSKQLRTCALCPCPLS